MPDTMLSQPKLRAIFLLLACLHSGVLLAATTGITGGSQPFNNMQPSLATNYIIRLQGDTNSLGEVAQFAGTFAPGGWAFADGQLLPVAQNMPLFNRIGATYGGDGVNTFALPDLRGRTAIQHGQGPGLSNRALGSSVGTENVTLSVAQMPSHNHTLPPSSDTTSSTGGGQPFSNMQPSLAMNYAINLEGDIPGQSGVQPYPLLGQVRLFAGSAAPPGNASANGQLIPVSQNTDLFGLIGTTYGGNGQVTFALPDLRSRAVIHEGQGPGLTNRILGQELGAEQGTVSQSQMATHNHTLPPTSDTTGNTGGGQPHNTIQPSLVLNYIVATQGSFPSRTDPATEPFLGQIALFAGNFAPGGWAFADGQLLPVSQNTALFSLLGTTYGGNGVTTFGLPDLRGRIAIHTGQGPGLSDRDAGEVTGLENVTLTVAQLPAHTHEFIPEPASLLYAAIALLLLGSCKLRRSAC
jgi:microcystin-dependent protein